MSNCLTIRDETLLIASFCYPHLVAGAKTSDLDQFRQLTSDIISNTETSLNQRVFELIIITQTRIKCKDSNLKDLLPIIFTLVADACDARKILALRFIDLAVTAIGADDLVKNQLIKSLAPLLHSHHSEQRLLGAHILSALEMHHRPNEENAYTLMYKIENSSIDVFNYRDHIMWLDRMRPSSTFMKNVENTEVKAHIVRFLFGMLYKNFKLIWEPTMELLVVYSAHLEVAVFWEILNERLEFARQEPELVENVVGGDFAFDSLRTMFESLVNLKENADFGNYRSLLWTMLSKVPAICDTKNRDIVGLYLKFYNEEFLPINR